MDLCILAYETLRPSTYHYNVSRCRTSPIYFLSDREDSQAYHLKWWKLQLMHLCRSVEILAAVMWPRGVLYAPPVGSRVSPRCEGIPCNLTAQGKLSSCPRKDFLCISVLKVCMGRKFLLPASNVQGITPPCATCIFAF